MNLLIDCIYFVSPRLKSWATCKNQPRRTVSRVSVTLILVLFFSGHSIGQTSQFDSLVTSGINQIYSLEFNKAEATFTTLKKSYPYHPAIQFFPAMITWWKIMIDLDNEAYDDLFLDQLEETIDFCDDLIDENSNNIDAVFFKGGALGFRGRLFSIREDWLDAAADGKDALPLVYEAYRLDSTNVDVQFGFGIYNYYADVIPEKYPFIKPVLFFFPEGDREKGLQQLSSAAYNGKFTRVESKYFLMTLYYKFEENNSEALKYAEELVKQFPINPTFQKFYARILRRLSRLTDSTNEFREMYNLCDKGMTGYNDKIKREASYYLADEQWRNADFEKAIKFYKECSDLSISFEQEDDGFNVVSLLQLGKIYDVLNQRDKAKYYYEEVLDLDDYNNSHDKAEQFLETAFKR